MDRSEILAMKPGRELDVLVAEKVMGWHITFGPWSGSEYWEDDNLHIPHEVDKFKPSIDISAAWEVVEKLREKQIYFNIHADKKSYFVLAFVRADSAPEAICKAALLAVLEGDERNANDA